MSWVEGNDSALSLSKRDRMADPEAIALIAAAQEAVTKQGDEVRALKAAKKDGNAEQVRYTLSPAGSFLGPCPRPACDPLACTRRMHAGP